MTHVMGIDISTTATKAVVMARDGEIVGLGSYAYDFQTPRSLWAEQDSHIWWTATQAAVRMAVDDGDIDPLQIRAIGLTGQMHGLVLLDDADAVLRPAILWNDQRSGAECDEMRQRIGRRRMIEVTGNEALTGFTASKLLWVRNHEPDVFAKVRHVLLPKDYVRLRLTGEHATDKAGASGTQLFDIARRDWSDEVLEALGLDRAWFPTTFEGPETAGLLGAAVAKELGMKAGIPVVAGGGDQAANAVGTGVVREGQTALSLGTSGVVFAATNEPRVDPEGRVHAFCHALPERWHLMGVMLSAAGSLRWFRDTMAPTLAYEDIDRAAGSVGAGSDGVLFAPYLTGERTPYPDPHATGAFVGLTVRHQFAHLARAVMEGVAFGLKDGLDLMIEVGLPKPDHVVISGGGTRSAVWMQIIADTLDVELRTPKTIEGAAYGAAVLAAVGSGWYQDVEAAAEDLVSTSTLTEPGTDRDFYVETHRTYRKLYPALKQL